MTTDQTGELYSSIQRTCNDMRGRLRSHVGETDDRETSGRPTVAIIMTSERLQRPLSSLSSVRPASADGLLNGFPIASAIAQSVGSVRQNGGQT